MLLILFWQKIINIPNTCLSHWKCRIRIALNACPPWLAFGGTGTDTLLSFSSPPSGTEISAFLAILYSTEHAVMTSKFVDSLNLNCCRNERKRLFHIPNTFSIFTRALV
jgi:hypothetical protein